MNKRLNNKKAIITGGSRGIGEGIVRRLYDEGAEIIIADIKEDLARELISELDNDRGNVNFYKVDVSDEKQIKELFEFTDKKWGTLDILINNAGIEDGDLLENQTYENYKKTININMDASFLTSKYSLPLFEKNG